MLAKISAGGIACTCSLSILFKKTPDMALKATIFKVELSIADMDRNVFADFALTLARHPSENDARMMVRLLAFMKYAHERLEFGKGLSTDEEADLWQKDLTGVIDLWIYVGQLDERWLRKAAGRAAEVVVFTHGDRVADVWWEQNRARLEKISNLTIYRIAADDTQTLAAMVDRTMSLQCTIQDGEMLITSAGHALHIEPERVFGKH